MANDLAPMLVSIIFILTAGGVILLRPIIRHLAEYLQALTEDRRALKPTADMERLLETMNRIENRLEFVEERQQFAEELLGNRAALPTALPSDNGRSGMLR